MTHDVSALEATYYPVEDWAIERETGVTELSYREWVDAEALRNS